MTRVEQLLSRIREQSQSQPTQDFTEASEWAATTEILWESNQRQQAINPRSITADYRDMMEDWIAEGEDRGAISDTILGIWHQYRESGQLTPRQWFAMVEARLLDDDQRVWGRNHA